MIIIAPRGFKHSIPMTVLVGIIFFAGVLASGAALAARTIQTSRAPYWQVGINDPTLSRLCATNKFNERVPYRYVIRFTGKIGPGVLGVAKGTGLNLYDPTHVALKSEDYFFMDDGSSSCAVYVGGRKK